MKDLDLSRSTGEREVKHPSKEDLGTPRRRVGVKIRVARKDERPSTFYIGDSGDSRTQR